MPDRAHKQPEKNNNKKNKKKKKQKNIQKVNVQDDKNLTDDLRPKAFSVPNYNTRTYLLMVRLGYSHHD